jgi:hypothetical protein
MRDMGLLFRGAWDRLFFCGLLMLVRFFFCVLLRGAGRVLLVRLFFRGLLRGAWGRVLLFFWPGTLDVRMDVNQHDHHIVGLALEM